MKVLLCTSTIRHTTTGSAGVARMIAQMGNENISVDVVSEDADHDDRSIQPSSLRTRFPPIAYYFRNKKLWQTIRTQMCTMSYDLVVFNDVWLAFGARFYLKDNKRKEVIVAFVHDDNTLDMSDLRFPSGRWLNFRSRAFFENRIIGNLDAVLTNSDYMLRALSKVYQGKSVYRLYYTAMDYAQVKYQPRQINTHQAIRILFIKSDFERGGLQELIGALKSLDQYQFILTIVGPSEINVRRKLGEMIKNTSQLTFAFMGAIYDQHVVKELYHTHDLVCVPSGKEALGLVNAEALASGIPVVSTGVGGIPEVLDNGNGGLITKGRSAKHIALAIDECISRPDLTLKRVEHGRRFVVERFALARMYADLTAIFEDILAKKRMASG